MNLSPSTYSSEVFKTFFVLKLWMVSENSETRPCCIPRLFIFSIKCKKLAAFYICTFEKFENKCIFITIVFQFFSHLRIDTWILSVMSSVPASACWPDKSFTPFKSLLFLITWAMVTLCCHWLLVFWQLPKLPMSKWNKTHVVFVKAP